MSHSRSTNTSTASDALLPGKGHTPSYGIGESDDSYRTVNSKLSDSPIRWHVVALCVLTACIASMVAGMSISFSSIIINELSSNSTNSWLQPQQQISSDGTKASLIGVSTKLPP